VAVHCGRNAFWGAITATGGDGADCGGAGSIYIKSANETYGHLYFDNADHLGATTPLSAGTYECDVLTVRRGARVNAYSEVLLKAALLEVREGGVMNIKDAVDFQTERLSVSSKGVLVLDTPLSVPSVQIEPGGILTHSSEEGNIDLTVTGNMTVHTDGRVSVDGKGYAPGTGPGAGKGGTNYGSGAGHGGAGGSSNNEHGCGASEGAVYGHPNQPASFGSGGGQGYAKAGGAGGGTARLTVGGVLKVDGAVTADGCEGDGQPHWGGGGGGSGGSLHLTAQKLTGSGQVSADGGDGYGAPGTNCGGGGGGRVAIYAGQDEFYGRVSVDGGDGFEPGREGSIVRGKYTWGCGDLLHPYPSGDLNADCRVDMLDLGLMSSHWLVDTNP
jgi:hypothetical protein